MRITFGGDFKYKKVFFVFKAFPAKNYESDKESFQAKVVARCLVNKMAQIRFQKMICLRNMKLLIELTFFLFQSFSRK